LGRLDDAIKDFKQTINLDQDDPDAYRYMGICLHQLGKIEEALTYFSAAIDMGDSSASILVSRALAYLDAKKYELAASDVDLALKVKNCNMAHAYYAKAIVLMHSGEEPQALKGSQTPLPN
jgi:tetratricopeptide (TPR) repeat protein